jgi:hypothetical protein
MVASGRTFWGRYRRAALGLPRLRGLAEAYGCFGVRVTSRRDDVTRSGVRIRRTASSIAASWVKRWFTRWSPGSSIDEMLGECSASLEMLDDIEEVGVDNTLSSLLRTSRAC